MFCGANLSPNCMASRNLEDSQASFSMITSEKQEGWYDVDSVCIGAQLSILIICFCCLHLPAHRLLLVIFFFSLILWKNPQIRNPDLREKMYLVEEVLVLPTTPPPFPPPKKAATTRLTGQIPVRSWYLQKAKTDPTLIGQVGEWQDDKEIGDFF